MEKKKRSINIEKLSDKMLKFVEKHQSHLCKKENLNQLAYVMLRWEILYHVGRVCFGYEGIVRKGYQCENNPKYELGDGKIKYDSEENENIIYDAWGIAVGLTSERGGTKCFVLDDIDYTPDNNKKTPILKLQAKKNKTMDDYVNLMTDPKYRYNSLFPDTYRVYDYLLCTIGTGYGWNKDGYICPTGPSDMDEDDYGNPRTGWIDMPEQMLAELNMILHEPQYVEYEKMAREYVKTEIVKHRLEQCVPFLRRQGEYLAKAGMVNQKGELSPEHKRARMAGEKILNMLDSGDAEKILALYEHLMDSMIKNRANDREDKQRRHYPLCEYSCIVNMPDNAHESYWKAGKVVALEILAEPTDDKKHRPSPESVKHAAEFLRRYAAKFNEVIPINIHKI